MQITYFAALLGYIILLLGVSFLFSRRMKNLEDFFLASRRLPGFLVYLSLTASWIGATSTLVSVDEAYANGLSSFWIMGFPAVATVLIFAFFLTSRIRRLPIFSLPDLVEMRYGKTVRHMASVLIVWYMVVLASSQMVAAGQFLGQFVGINYLNGLLLGVGVVLIYSVFGGFFSVVVTDGFQFFCIAAGLAGLLIFLVGSYSFSDVCFLAQNHGKVGYFNLFHDFERSFLVFISFTMAWIISPIAWQRIQSAQDEKKAKNGLFASSVTFFLFYGAVVLIGILSLALFSSANQEGPILSVIIASNSGYLLGGILFIAVTASLMSTMDTAINTGALSLTRDVYQQIFQRKKSNHVVLISRIATLVIGGLAFLIATRLQSILTTLGLASEIMCVGFFIPGIAMLYFPKKKPFAGGLSLSFGALYSFIGFLSSIEFIHLKWLEWPYSVPAGLGISGAGFLVGLVIDRLNESF
ncbi:MAG: sodium:solute symporter family protein [Acidobacteriota bacterium]